MGKGVLTGRCKKRIYSCYGIRKHKEQKDLKESEFEVADYITGHWILETGEELHLGHIIFAKCHMVT